jgi:ABC-type transport system involved in cytochrome c biogenesis permease component
MEFLLQIIIAGMAVGYVTEFVAGLLDRWISSTITKRLTTLPMGTLFLWLLGVEGLALAVAIPASGFFALVILSFVNRPVVISGSGRRV